MAGCKFINVDSFILMLYLPNGFTMK